MAIVKENDLVNSVCIVKILYKEFLRYVFFFFFLFAKCILYLDVQHISTVIIFYFKYKLHVAVSFGGNAA